MENQQLLAYTRQLRRETPNHYYSIDSLWQTYIRKQAVSFIICGHATGKQVSKCSKEHTQLEEKENRGQQTMLEIQSMICANNSRTVSKRVVVRTYIHIHLLRTVVKEPGAIGGGYHGDEKCDGEGNRKLQQQDICCLKPANSVGRSKLSSEYNLS